MSVTHATFTIERSYPKPPAAVFKAFADPALKRVWFAEGKGFSVDSFETDFRVGGLETSRFRMTADSPIPNAPIGNDSVYLDIVPNERIILAYTMTIHGAPMSCSLATFTIAAEGAGSRLTMTEQGCYFENSDGAAGREKGWNGLADALGKSLG